MLIPKYLVSGKEETALEGWEDALGHGDFLQPYTGFGPKVAPSGAWYGGVYSHPKGHREGSSFTVRWIDETMA